MDVFLLCKVILLSVLAYANSEEENNLKQCEFAVNGVEHKRETLADNLGKPFMLTVDYARNQLYFSHTINSTEGTNFQVLNIDLQTNDCFILNIDGAFAPAVDRKTNKIFIGTDDGIFEYDPIAETSKKVGADSKNIWMMFYTDKLYFTTYPKEEANYLENNETKPVIGLEDVATEILVFDKNGRMYTANCSGLFSFEKNESDSNLVGDYIVNGITTDKDGMVFFSTPSTLNVVDLKTNTVKKLLTSHDVIYGVAVDLDGNLLYADESSIFRLTPTDNQCAEKNNENDEDST